MVDAGIKKVTIKSAELPYIQFTKIYNSVAARTEIDQLYYNFRYRIISEDKNRFSHWSPSEKIIMPTLKDAPPPQVSPYPYSSSSRISITTSTTGNGGQKIVNITWTKPGDFESTDFEKIFNKIGIYDIWIRWNGSNTTNPTAAGWSDWQYTATISANNFSILIPTLPVVGVAKSIDFAIQIPTTEKLRDYNNNKLTLFNLIHSGL